MAEEEVVNIKEEVVEDKTTSEGNETNDIITISASDSAILSSLSDKDIMMNFSSIEDLCSQWNSKTMALNLTGDRVVSGLKVLTSYGIYETYATTLATAVNSLTSTITEVTTSIRNTSDTQKTTDINYSSGRIGGNYNYVSYSGTNSDSSSNTTVNNNQENSNITVANIEKIATLNDYIGLSTLLYSIGTNKNTNLENILDNFDATVIKEKILASVNLSDELKKVLYNLDDKVLKETLTQLQKNGSIKEFQASDIEYLNNYLEKIALRNNTSVIDIITNNKDLLNSEIGVYEKAVDLLDDKKVAQDIYDGNEIASIETELVAATRDIIDIMADKNKITAEELLSNQSKLNQISTSKNFISFIKSGSNLENILKEIYIKRG